jgi:argininosuccinate lyase
MKNLWGGRFEGEPSARFVAFNQSLSVDRRLWQADIAGSLAWCKALAKAGVLDEREAREIATGLRAISIEIENDPMSIERSAAEDVHTFVESRLTAIVGDAARKLHTGRSRNDQVATDLKLYLKSRAASVDARLVDLVRALVALAEPNAALPMPGYTHLQRAQPITVGHHLLAYVEMFARDRRRLTDAVAGFDVSPLGSGALAGTAFAVDRAALAKDLGFAKATANSLDAVSDRDFLVEFLAAAALTGVHFSRLAADLTLWATAEFGFVEFSDAFATGSSIMPQKKNPDVAELIRGKSGRLAGNLVALLTTLKGLPLAYNSDMQEDKEPFFDSVDTLEAILGVLPPLLASLTFRTERMREAAGEHFATATDLADYLVRKGLPFREAHEVVGRVVLHASRLGTSLEDLPLEDLRRFSSLIDADVKDALGVDASLRARAVTGGTAPVAVARALATARALLASP